MDIILLDKRNIKHMENIIMFLTFAIGTKIILDSYHIL